MTIALRRPARAALCAVLLAAPAAGIAAPAEPESAAAYEARIERLSRIDPEYPEALEARLDYAGFLAKARDEDCRRRLDQAQALLDTVAASPVTETLLPFGPARVQDLAYRVHLARADCGDDPPARERELKEALESAHASLSLYRDAFDYRSMAFMQFNLAHTARELGDDPAALASLERALEMDREYGLRDDAEENYGFLLDWSGAHSSEAKVAARMKDFPARAATLRFGWHPADAEMTMEEDVARIVAGKVARRRLTVTGTGSIRAEARGWVVTQTAGEVELHQDGAPVADESARKISAALARIVAQLPQVVIARDGSFRDIVDLDRFQAHAASEGEALVGSLVPEGDPRGPRVRETMAKAIQTALAPEVLAGRMREGYGLETGIWIGATLKQGTWYEMSTVLTMPGTPQGFLKHQLEFAFTRLVPCTREATVATCAEIVVHATPDPEALVAMLARAKASMKLPADRDLHYWSTTHVRLVTDPVTLFAYQRETRRYSYLSAGAASEREVTSSRIVSATTYR